MYRDDDTVGIQLSAPLGVSEEGLTLFINDPFSVNDDGHLAIKIGGNLEIKDGALNAKDVDSLLKGAGAISVYRDPLESLEGAIVKLDVDHENFQQTGGKLAFRSTGTGEIPYDSGLSSLRRSDAFVSDSDEAVTSSYVEQLYQSGSTQHLSWISTIILV
ncbi:hypothetical protein DFS34DRAFT_611050 [Phlyctochytrium arcticum]|nr:hypothetical protein DFS34DRAFT_611050 [Phlyctochytrium arcticum]